MAVADSYTTTAGVELVVSAGQGVLANDSDPDSAFLVADLAASTAHGTLVLHPNGSFEYTPAAGFSESDTFTYRVYDGQDYSEVVAVRITVVGNRYRALLPTIIR